MFFRISALQDIGLFDERFFMYGEDIDLSRRMHLQYRTMYYPGASIVHLHEAASYKNRRMLLIHIRNIIRYFNKWGWFFDAQRRKINRRLLKDLNYNRWYYIGWRYVPCNTRLPELFSERAIHSEDERFGRSFRWYGKRWHIRCRCPCLLSRCGRRRCNRLEARGQEAVRSLLPALSLFIGWITKNPDGFHPDFLLTLPEKQMTGGADPSTGE